MSKVLTITITEVTDEDYSGNPVTTKNVSSCINDNGSVECTSYTSCEEDSVTDTDCKTNHKTALTALGFTWDSEA